MDVSHLFTEDVNKAKEVFNRYKFNFEEIIDNPKYWIMFLNGFYITIDEKIKRIAYYSPNGERRRTLDAMKILLGDTDVIRKSGSLGKYFKQLEELYKTLITNDFKSMQPEKAFEILSQLDIELETIYNIYVNIEKDDTCLI